MAAAAFASLPWTSAPMPASDRPVQLARLPAASDGAFRAFVRFPAGWHRADAGHYAAAEEFLVLEGALHLNNLTWKAGGYAWIPAHQPRHHLGSTNGCLVFAWFGAAPRWMPGAPAQTGNALIRFAHWREASQGLLYDGPEHRSSIGGTGCEALDLKTLHWQTREQPVPFTGEVLVRSW